MSKTTVILTHSGSDFDAISSMYTAEKLYPGSFLVHPGSLDVSTQKLAHFFGDMLRLIKVKELPDKIKDSIERVIVVDTKIFNRIGDGKEFIKKKGVEVIIFDHHPPSSHDIKKAKIISKNYGANTTLLVELLEKKRIPLTTFEATFIALGIYEDTGSFMFPSTSAADFAAMKYLASFGVNMKVVNHFLSPSLGEDQIHLYKELLDNIEECNIKGARIAIASGKMSAYTPGISLIAHRMREIVDSDFLFVLVSSMDGIFIVGRSSSPQYDLKKVLLPLGGGGHPTAASVFVKNGDVLEIKKQILENIEKIYFPVLKAEHIMSFPVKTISAKAGIKEALKIMVRFGFSGLPVEENNRIIGIISKRDIEKIMLIENRDRPVKQYLLSNLVEVSPDTGLRGIEEAMVLTNVGRVIVTKKGKIVGIISRSDLLKAFYTKEYISESSFSANAAFIPKKEEIALLLKKKFPPDIFNLLQKMGAIALESNQKIYLVGGAVRDILLNKKSLDLDFVVSKDAILFGKRLQEGIGGDVLLYPEFQTSTCTYKDYMFDFVTARREYYNSHSLLPVIERASIREDLGRRDFTINTLAIDLLPDQFGNLYDFFGGFSDLRKREIRVLHSLSFLEDPSRILRAIKYEIKFNFHLSDDTEQLLVKTVCLNVLRFKKSRRILDELFELFSSSDAPLAILKMEKRGILKDLFRIKRLSARRKEAILQAKRWIKYFPIDQAKVYFFLLVFGRSDVEKRDILQYFSFSKRLIEKVVVAENAFRKLHSTTKTIDKIDLFFLLRNIDRAFIVSYLSWASSDERALLIDYLETLSNIKIGVKGRDLLKLGLKPGPQYKEIFDELLRLRITGMLHSKKEEIQYILSNKERFELKQRK